MPEHLIIMYYGSKRKSWTHVRYESQWSVLDLGYIYIWLVENRRVERRDAKHGEGRRTVCQNEKKNEKTFWNYGKTARSLAFHVMGNRKMPDLRRVSCIFSAREIYSQVSHTKCTSIEQNTSSYIARQIKRPTRMPRCAARKVKC